MLSNSITDSVGSRLSFNKQEPKYCILYLCSGSIFAALLVLAGCSTTSNTGNESGSSAAGGAAPTSGVTGGAGSTVTGAGGIVTGAGGAAGTTKGTGGRAAAKGGAGGVSGKTGVGGASGKQTGGSGGEGPCTKDVTAKPGQDECTAPLKPEDDRLCKITVDGTERQFYIYAPKSYNPCKPASLIMDCHGASETAEVHTGLDGFASLNFPPGYGSGWRRAIQGDNVIVVTPQGIGNMWTPATDVAFVNKAADTVEAIAEVDKEKVYITGISMGGMMTVATGCDSTTGARWKGMVPVAMLTQSCAGLAHSMPVISFHATGDQLTSYEDDETLMGRIAGMNNCKSGPTPDPTRVYGGPNTVKDPVCFPEPVNAGAPEETNRYGYSIVECKTSLPESSCVTWSQCDNAVEVVFCTISADSQPIGGHILYHNDTGLQLAKVAWGFLKKFWK